MLKRFLCMTALAACVALLCLSGCSNSGDASDDNPVAAEVNGEKIYESSVTAAIDSYRNQADMADDAAWAKYLIDNSLNASDLRTQTIESLVQRKLVIQQANEMQVAPSDDEVSAYVSSTKESMGDEQWQKSLDASGSTEEQVQETARFLMCKQAICDTLTKDDSYDQDEILAHAKFFANAYDGAKRSSMIRFDASAAASAQEVLDAINNGKITFEDAAAAFSNDQSSAHNGGDMGWNVSSKGSDSYEVALAALAKGQMSDVVADDSACYIILCTDEYHAPSEITSIDQVPQQAQDSIMESFATRAKTAAFTEWYEGVRGDANVTINDMPQGLSYDVDIDAYNEQKSELDDTAEKGSSEQYSESELEKALGTAQESEDAE